MREIKHGTNAGVTAHRVQGVPMCEPCRLAKNEYARLCKERGPVRPRVPATEVLVRIGELLAVGLRICDVASAAGLPNSTVVNVWEDRDVPNKKVSLQTHEAIMAVSADWARPTVIPAVEAVKRRVQALMYMGWTHRDLTAAGINLPDDRFRGTENVTTDLFQRWDQAYRRFSGEIGPSKKATFKAYRNNWAGPNGWENIDDPDEVPDIACIVCNRPSHRRSLCQYHNQLVGICRRSNDYYVRVHRLKNKIDGRRKVAA